MKVYIARHDLTPADEAAMWVNEAVFTTRKLAEQYINKRPGYKIEGQNLRAGVLRVRG